MTRELIDYVIDGEMKLEKETEEYQLALNYLTQMVEQGYVATEDPAKRYTIQEIMDMTFAYLDGYHDAMKVLELSIQSPKGRAPRACTWVNVKGKDIRSFLNNIYPALGQAKLEFLKNHELARGYL
jgi:hypothetical protein